jgi:predicted nucleotidyltransferase
MSTDFWGCVVLLLSEPIHDLHDFLSTVADVQRSQLLDYVEALSIAKKAQVSDLSVLVFGSVAMRSCKPWSDVDLAVVSDYFSGVPWGKRVISLGVRVSSKFSLISPIALTYDGYETYSYPAIIRFIRGNHVRVL